MAFSAAWRYGGAGIAGGVGGAYLGGDPGSALIGAGVGVGAYGLYKSGAVKRVGAPIAAGIGRRISPGVKAAFKTGGRLLGKAFVGLEAVMIASEMKEGRGIASDVYEAYNRNDPIGMAQGMVGGAAGSALTLAFFPTAAPLLLPLMAAKEAYALGQAGRKHLKRLRKTELYGSPELLRSIHSPGAATMRQRSLLALQNTHINARMSMGNEAMMIHQPFR